MSCPNYRIRFYVEKWSLTERDAEVLKSLPKAGLYDFDTPASSSITYFDESLEYVWFEAFLPFVPSIGTGYNPKATGFNWDEDIIPMVETIIYYEKERIFIAELSWGLDNHLEVARSIFNEVRKQNKRR